MRTVELEVLREEGWKTIIFEGVEKVAVAGAPGEGGLTLTLIGIREDRPNQVETGVLDVADRHEPLLDADVPKTEDGRSVPIAYRDY